MRKKYFGYVIVIAVVVLSVLCAGCSSKKEATNQEKQTVDLQALQEAMIKADTTLPEMKVAMSTDEEAEEEFSVFSDFSYDRVQSFVYAYAADGGCQEIAVVQLKEAGDAAALMNTFKEHLKERHDALAVYQPEQVPLVDHAVIKQKGSLVTMIISEKNGLIQKVFEEVMCEQ